MDREGYYTVIIKVDLDALGLHNSLGPIGTCERVFAVGKEPVLPTIAAFNRTVPVLGGAEEEQRLGRIIHDTIKSTGVASGPLPAELQEQLRWSEPVNGLAARIEEVFDWRETTALVRLKNTSREAIVVPTGNPKDESATQAFEIKGMTSYLAGYLRPRTPWPN